MLREVMGSTGSRELMRDTPRLQGEDSGVDHCAVFIPIQLIPISGYLMRS